MCVYIAGSFSAVVGEGVAFLKQLFKKHCKNFLALHNNIFFPAETLSGQNFPFLLVIDNGPVVNLCVSVTVFTQIYLRNYLIIFIA